MNKNYENYNRLLIENEKIVWVSESLKTTALLLIFGLIFLPFFLIGVMLFIHFFRGKMYKRKKPLIVTDKRILIYDKLNKDYTGIYFTDIENWAFYSVSIIFNGGQSERKFVFMAFGKTYSFNSIINYKNIYRILYCVIPKACQNPLDIKNVELGNILLSIRTGDIIINNAGSSKDFVMKVVHKYTNEDYSVISEKLQNLPCVMIEKPDERDMEMLINILSEADVDFTIK